MLQNKKLRDFPELYRLFPILVYHGAFVAVGELPGNREGVTGSFGERIEFDFLYIVAGLVVISVGSAKEKHRWDAVLGEIIVV